MTIILPASPLPQTATPRPIDGGAWQTPIAGGLITRLDRPGANKMALDIALPRLKPEPDGRIWASRCTDAIGNDAQFSFPQLGFAIGDPGAPLVDGGGQGGNQIALKGMRIGYVVREGQWFNLYDASGRAYLWKASGDATVDDTGRVAVPLGYTLSPRLSPADGSTANFAAPVIVGQLSGFEAGWTWERFAAREMKLTITERR